jgi:multidrug resistance efflux pump
MALSTVIIRAEGGDPCAAIKLENAKLHVENATLKLQFLQSQSQLMQQAFEQAQNEKRAADVELEKLQPKVAEKK